MIYKIVAVLVLIFITYYLMNRSSPSQTKDGGHSGPFIKKVKELFNIDLEIVLPIKDKGPGFHVRPWCWIVERTLSWLDQHRRISKNYERLESPAEALI